MNGNNTVLRSVLAVVLLAIVVGVMWFIEATPTSPSPGDTAVLSSMPSIERSADDASLSRPGENPRPAVTAVGPSPTAPRSRTPNRPVATPATSITTVPPTRTAVTQSLASMASGPPGTVPAADPLADPIMNQDETSRPRDRTSRQSLAVIAESDREALVQSAVEAEEITPTKTADEAKEAALKVAEKQATDPAAPAKPTGETTSAMTELLQAFGRETDAEHKQDLLAAARELADSSGEPMTSLLALALQGNQPLEVQRQALYLATDADTPMVQRIAANPAHPLQEDAEAFLLQQQLDRGITPKPQDD